MNPKDFEDARKWAQQSKKAKNETLKKAYGIEPKEPESLWDESIKYCDTVKSHQDKFLTPGPLSVHATPAPKMMSVLEPSPQITKFCDNVAEVAESLNSIKKSFKVKNFKTTYDTQKLKHKLVVDIESKTETPKYDWDSYPNAVPTPYDHLLKIPPFQKQTEFPKFNTPKNPFFINFCSEEEGQHFVALNLVKGEIKAVRFYKNVKNYGTLPQMRIMLGMAPKFNHGLTVRGFIPDSYPYEDEGNYSFFDVIFAPEKTEIQRAAILREEFFDS